MRVRLIGYRAQRLHREQTLAVPLARHSSIYVRVLKDKP